MLAEALRPNNDVPHPAIVERARRAHAAWRARRILMLPLVGLGLLALLGQLPAPRTAGLLLIVAAIAAELEMRIALRATSKARFDGIVVGFRIVIATSAIAAAPAMSLPFGILPVMLMIVLVSAALMVGGWALIVLTAYASLALICVDWLLPALGYADIGARGTGATVTLFAFACVGYPAAAWYVRHALRGVLETRNELDRTAERLRMTEGALGDSQRELQGWNEQLQSEVGAQTRELEERNRYLSIVSAVSFTLSDSMDDGASLERAIRLVARLLDMRAAQAYQLGGSDDNRSLFVPVLSDDVDVPRLPESLLRRVAERGEYENSQQASGGATVCDIGEPYVAVPLVAKGRVVGALGLIGARPRSLADHERPLLLLLGREIGIVLENGRLYHDAIERADRERLLAEAVRLMNGRGSRDRAMTQALELLSKHLGAEVAALIALPEGPRKPQVVALVSADRSSLDEPLERLLRGAPALVSDRWSPMVLGDGGEGPLSPELVQRGVGTLVLAPVIAVRSTTSLLPQRWQESRPEGSPVTTRSMVGVLAIAMPTGSAWDENRTEIVAGVGAILSRRMETDELLQLQQRRITELSGLAEIARLMQTGADTERLYSGFAQALFTLLTYQDLYIARLDDTGQISEIPSYTAGGRSQPQPQYATDDRDHRWFGLRAASAWVALEDKPPLFVDADDRVGLVVPMRPKGQLLGLVVLGLSTPPQPDQVRIIEQAVEQLALALDGAALYRQATERASHIQALSNLARIVASVVDLREAFDAFAEEVRWLIPFERVVMLLMEPQSEMIEPYATYPEEAAALRQAWPLTSSLAELAVNAGGPVAVSRDDPRYADYDWNMFGVDARQVAAVPVRHGTRAVAVFALVQSSETSYSVSDLDALGEVAGLLGVTIERLRLYEQAEHSARHDALTELPNYRFLQERLARLRAGITEPGQSAVILVDMDGLKLFNDTLGHEAGDRVIQVVAGALRASVRDVDFVARTGGDEFVVVLEGVTPEGAHAASARVHEALEFAHLEFANAPCPIAISVGVAVAPDDTDNTAELMQLADHAMYNAKFGGGNRTVFVSDSVQRNASNTLRGRQSRLLELAMQACTDGATRSEHAALARAERFLTTLGERRRISDVRMMALRLLVAGQAGKRIAKPGNPVNRRIAGVLVRGATLELNDAEAKGATFLSDLPSAIVELGWLQRTDANGGALSLSDAMRVVREQFAGVIPPDLLDEIELIAIAAEAPRPERLAA